MTRLALLLCCLALPALADRDDHDRARRALEAGEILPLSQILTAAEAARPGRVIEVELDRDDGLWRYELELITPGGRLYEMKIDAATGTVLEIEREEDD
ncbi:PepSY domain-containing protein [Salipiger abyssi]|uniref:Peptidase propeptide domain-containing protein n=1 Tax=Salipiger abyssi TaxID=1250539 RepID=A0A1P8UP56_9RHOB|nr:PepSY domain-containing protein [Salipiger abyssi]APZ51183.1 Peptidase propeptide domain-containing protein [Salipiger abyssi]